MRFPLHVATDQIRYQIGQSLRGRKRYPFVLMLEPLYTCNLACIGCAIERHTGKLADRLPLADCLRAVDQCGAPTVSICGGEPTLYPELPALIDGIVGRSRHIYLCTNGLLLDSPVFGRIAPRKRLTINVHLDGMRETHDKVCAREGVFDKAIEMISAAKRRGYHVTTNTTVFKETSVEEIEQLCALVAGLGIDGMLVSPGYHYESVTENLFPTRQEIHRKFERVLELSKRYPLI
jgi:hopanoid biosynthesis associated radical SAM protein HpnH